MVFSINEFRGALRDEGARASLFRVRIINPINGTGDILTPFLVRAAQIPESNITPIDIPYMGRSIKVPGSRPSATDWSCTVINDENFLIRNALEAWHNSINSLAGNVRLSNNIYSVVQVDQLSKTEVVLRTYELISAFPNNISPIQLGWDQDQVEEFDVTFSFDYHRVSGGTTGTGGGV